MQGPFLPPPSPSHDASYGDATYRVVLLFGPLAILVVVLRLLEYSLLRRTGPPDLPELLWSNAPVPFLVGLVVFVFVLALRQARPGWHPFWSSGTTAAFALLLFWGTSYFGPWWLTQWMSLKAFAFVKEDLLLLLLSASAFVMLLEATRGWGHRVALSLLYLYVFLLLTLSATTFTYFLATGAPGDAYLIRYFITHLSDLLPLISSELTSGRLLLLTLPIALLVLPSLFSRYVTPGRGHGMTGSCARRWFFIAMPFCALLAFTPKGDVAFDRSGGSYAHLFVDLLVPDHGDEDDLGLALDAKAFDTHALRLAETDSTHRMNIVVIILESVGRRAITPYDTTLDTTPFLSQLAANGLVIEDLYTVIPHTNKSLVSLFTGVYPLPKREMVESEPGGLPGPGIPGLLEPHGYRSAFFTSATLAYEEKGQLLENLGFDTYHGLESYPEGPFVPKAYFGAEDRIMLAPSLGWVDEVVAQGAPFFLSYLTLTAHHPYDTPPGYPTREWVADHPERNAYYNAVHYTDAFVRDLFAGFADRGLLDETVFIILGDHGEAFGEHGQRTHGDIIWDEVLAIPGLVYNPILFPKGRRITGLRQNIDLLPTTADLLNLEVAGSALPGFSLIQPQYANRSLFHSTWNGDLSLALRRDSLKFIFHNGREPMQVFDLSRDPYERRDIAAHIPNHQRRQAQLDLQLWRKRVALSY